MQLDYSIINPKERVKYVENLLQNYTPTQSELNLLSDYILFTKDKAQTKKERDKEYPITTSNRESTIDKRQISYEGLIEKFENGEDGIYFLISNSKEMKLDNKDPITQQDIEKYPGIKDCLNTIANLQQQYEKATGQKKKSLKSALIDTWKQVYLIKSSHKISPPISANKMKFLAYIDIPEEVEFNENDIPYSHSLLSLLNPEHVSFLLQYYQVLKEETKGLLNSDMFWHLIDLENLIKKALYHKYPVLWDVLLYKINKWTNKEIQVRILKDYGEQHTEQYYSSVWKKRIPKIITEQAQKDYLSNYCRRHHIGYWKKCSKCGQVKLGHPLFFNRNSSKDQFYSQCRDCRNKK